MKYQFFGFFIKRMIPSTTCNNPVTIVETKANINIPSSNIPRIASAIGIPIATVFKIFKYFTLSIILNFQKKMKVIIKKIYFIIFTTNFANQLSLYSVILSKTLSAFNTKSYNLEV